MPRICMFYGIIIYMHYLDNRKRHQPHFHARYNEHGAVISIKIGEVLSGSLPPAKMKLVLAWAEIHRKDLERAWDNLANGQKAGKIPPLR